MTDEFIDYGQLIDEAMHVIVKKALEVVVIHGLPGKHHFFISFLTDHPGVKISTALKQKYPDEMTIVLQHQFENLTVTEKEFSVTLSFEGVKEAILVTFDALTAFADPSVKFGLQFRSVEDELDADEEALLAEIKEFETPDEEEEVPAKGAKKKGKGAAKGKDGKKSKKTNVVDIDAFRKK